MQGTKVSSTYSRCARPCPMAFLGVGVPMRRMRAIVLAALPVRASSRGLCVPSGLFGCRLRPRPRLRRSVC